MVKTQDRAVAEVLLLTSQVPRGREAEMHKGQHNEFDSHTCLASLKCLDGRVAEARVCKTLYVSAILTPDSKNKS